MAERLEMMVENAEIGFLNFSGRETAYNDEGKRNFLLFLDPKDADKLFEDGWNIKTEKPKDEDEPDRILRPFLQVAVRYDKMPPRIFMITTKNRTLLTEDTVSSLDVLDISMVDLIVSGSPWEMNGKTGIKAYVKSMYVTIKEDALALKYGDLASDNDNEEGV